MLFILIIIFDIQVNVKLFNYLAKRGWLFDGFFSHWQLAVESILQLANSSDSSESDQRSFRKRRGSLAPKGGPTAPAPLSKILRPIVESLEFVN